MMLKVCFGVVTVSMMGKLTHKLYKISLHQPTKRSSFFIDIIMISFILASAAYLVIVFINTDKMYTNYFNNYSVVNIDPNL